MAPTSMTGIGTTQVQQDEFVGRSLFSGMITPLRGWLRPLRTKAEVDAQHETIDVYFCEVPVKLTGKVLDVLKTIPEASATPLLHLRRVVKTQFLPAHLQRLIVATSMDVYAGQPTHSILLTSTTFSTSGLIQTLSSLLPHLAPSNLHTAPVPLHPPTSADHAAVLTKQYWPTIFTNTNPFGPHPSIVARATSEWTPSASKWMSLARSIASPTHARDGVEKGLLIATVIVERSSGGIEEVVAIARDARFAGPGASMRPNGNPAAHSVMRAIDLVARKRRRLACSKQASASSSSMVVRSDSASRNAAEASFSISHTNDADLSQAEREVLQQEGTLAPDGYLCLGLRVSTTHEPCVACCMALVHSRVSGVVFGREMTRTGGFGTAPEDDKGESEAFEGDNGGIESEGLDEDVRVEKAKVRWDDQRRKMRYGLFWREELNWRFLCWQWQVGEQPPDSGVESRVSRRDEADVNDGFVDLPPNTHA